MNTRKRLAQLQVTGGLHGSSMAILVGGGALGTGAEIAESSSPLETISPRGGVWMMG